MQCYSKCARHYKFTKTLGARFKMLRVQNLFFKWDCKPTRRHHVCLTLIFYIELTNKFYCTFAGCKKGYCVISVNAHISRKLVFRAWQVDCLSFKQKQEIAPSNYFSGPPKIIKVRDLTFV